MSYGNSTGRYTGTPSRYLSSPSSGLHPLSSSYSSAAVPSTISRARSPLTSRHYTPTALLEVPPNYSDRASRSPRSLSPSPSYLRASGTSYGGLKSISPTSAYGSSVAYGSPAGYALSGSKSASSLGPTRRLTGHDSSAGGSDRLRNRSTVITPSRVSADRSSRTSSVNSSTTSLNDDGEKDYRKLYNEEKEENDRLRIKLKKTEEELDNTKRELTKILQNNKNSLSDAEKRERRALERRLSEMEEEAKEMERLMSDNQRLKDENAALIRVISKLSK